MLTLAALLPFGRKTPAITPGELNADLQSLALSDEDLEDFAINLNVTPGIVGQWTAGTLPIPREKMRRISRAIDGQRRRAALRASGLPRCDWADSTDARVIALIDEGSAIAVRALVREMRDHTETCERCQAQLAYVRDRFGPPTHFPLPWWVRPFDVDELPLPRWVPQWGRPAATAFAISAAVVCAAALLMMLTLRPSDRRLIARNIVAILIPAAATTIIASTIGALAYSAARALLRSVPRVAAYVAGIGSTAAFAGTWCIAARVIWHTNPFANPELTVFLAILVVTAGVIFGHDILHNSAERGVIGANRY